MKAKCSSSSDLISGLPQNIIESILCMVSTRDAVKTSILSKNWRYSWTRIPELLFMDFMLIKSKDKQQEEEDEENTKKEELTRKYEVFNAINQVLSKHQGSILEFALFMHIYDECVEIDQIITYLSRKNTVKKLTLSLEGYPSLYKLHSSFFSLNQLTYISLRHCILDHQPTVNGFGQLTSLFLDCVVSSKELFLHVVSKSPLLKSFTMININTSDDDGYSHIFSHAFICELFGYMPVIEQLHLESSYEYFRQFDSYLPMIPTPLLHLKYVHLDESFFMGNGLPFAVSLIRSSPNMEKLKLEVMEDSKEALGIDSLTAMEYSDICLEHLKELELDCNEEMEFLKLILARSPILKVAIIGISITSKDADRHMLKVLLETPRASNTVKFIVECLDDSENDSENPSDG